MTLIFPVVPVLDPQSKRGKKCPFCGHGWSLRTLRTNPPHQVLNRRELAGVWLHEKCARYYKVKGQRGNPHHARPIPITIAIGSAKRSNAERGGRRPETETEGRKFGGSVWVRLE